jgi:hypothetical protein
MSPLILPPRGDRPDSAGRIVSPARARAAGIS